MPVNFYPISKKLLVRLSLALLILASGLFFWSCNLTQNSNGEQRASFDKVFDSIQADDSALIVFKTEDGKLIDTVFHGRILSRAGFENLPVNNWDGGKAVIFITAYKAGEIVYKVEKHYDGATDKTDTTFVIIVAGTSITSDTREIQMSEGDSIPLPEITVKPATLSDKAVLWSSDHPEIVSVGADFLKARKSGLAQVTVKLKADETKSLSFNITVGLNAKLPESIALSADTLYLATGGAPDHLTVKAMPSSASNAVLWSIEDATYAKVDSNGSVSGLKKGITKLKAVSKEKAAIYDTAWVVVSDPVPVESVRFLKDSTTLFIGGAAESLMVEVLPPKSNPAVDFTVGDPLVLNLKDGRISGLVDGFTTIVAKSKENPALSATLKVRVLSSQHVDGVSIIPHSLKLFTGGESLNLNATVSPSTAPQKIQWYSTNAKIAKVDEAGKVSPVSPGNIKVYAVSVADSVKKDSADIVVKTDVPQVSIGQDTVVSLGQTIAFLPVVALQEYGLVTQFKWDLDGNLAWDDSAAAVKSVAYKFDQEKEYLVRFYVRDTEGNETVVSKKVKAIKGPVVLIKSPLNNSYTNKSTVAVTWTINDVEQDSLKQETLKDGANILTRTAKDAAGTPFSTSITVYLDSLAPNKPSVHGPAMTPSTLPTWTWATGGSGGSGLFRSSLDVENFSASVETKDTVFTPVTALTEGVHTLYVQERDAALNWSASGRLAILVDKTPPGKPEVRVNGPALTKVLRPTFGWNGTGGGIGSFQYKIDNSDFNSGAVATTDTNYTSLADMTNGAHTLFVRERDSTGNWSLPGSAAVTIDNIAPLPPKLVGTSPTSVMPKWTWSSGGGGSGDYRYRLGDANFPSDAQEVKVLEYSLTTAVSKTSYNLFVEERDAAGNWSAPANLSILYDLSKPTVSFSSPQPSGTYLTRSGTLDITGGSTSPQGPGTIKTVTYAVDGVAGTLATNLLGDGSWSIKALPLVNNKTIVLKVTATDNIGNTGEASLSILMDNTAPAAPTLATYPPAVVNKADSRTSLQWTWSRTGAATDSFVVRMNGSDVSRQTGTSYTINNPGDGTYLLELAENDLAGNISSITTAANVTVDRTAPSAPTLSKPASPRKTAQWTWTGSGGDTFKCQLDDGAIATCTSPYNLPSPTDGDHTLNVEEIDAAGNPSSWSSTTVTIDLQVPVIAMTNYLTTPTQIFSTIQPFTGTASDERSMRYVQYQVGAADTWHLASGSNPWSFTPVLSSGTQTINIRAEDIAGNQTTTSVQVTYEPTVIFVLQGASGAKDGTSWANAFPELGPVLAVDKIYPAGTQIWVSEGSYVPAADEGFKMKSNVSINGGFAKEGTDRSLASRDLGNNASILGKYPDGSYVISNDELKTDGNYSYADNLTLADFQITESFIPIHITNATKATLKNIICRTASTYDVLFAAASNIDILDSHFDQNSTIEGAIRLDTGSKVRIRNTTVNNNTAGGSGGIQLENGTLCAGGTSSISGNNPSEAKVYSGSFSRESGVTIGPGGISDGSNVIVGSCPAPF